MVAGVYDKRSLFFLFHYVPTGERTTNMSFNRYVDRKFGSPVRALFVLMGLAIGVSIGFGICQAAGWL